MLIFVSLLRRGKHMWGGDSIWGGGDTRPLFCIIEIICTSLTLVAVGAQKQKLPLGQIHPMLIFCQLAATWQTHMGW